MSLLLGYVADELLTGFIAVVGLLGIVDKVLQQERQYGGIGVALVFCADSLIGTFLIVLCHQTIPVAHLGKELTGLDGIARLQQSAGIDVLHHVLVDRFDEIGGTRFPERYILSMVAQQHVTAHEQQGMLTAQA